METGRLANDGRLQMLKVKGVDERPPRGVTGEGHPLPRRVGRHRRPGARPSPTPRARPRRRRTTTRSCYVGNQGRAQGAAHFSRLEGTIYDNGVVYFTSTQGGGAAMGPGRTPSPATATASGRSGATTPGPRRSSSSTSRRAGDVLDFPDNITTSRRGTLILCEDNTDDNYMRGLSRGGQLWDIALNRLRQCRTAHRRFGDEFAGSTFSPDGHTLFVNIQASRRACRSRSGARGSASASERRARAGPSASTGENTPSPAGGAACSLLSTRGSARRAARAGR